MNTTKAMQRAPDDTKARASYVDELRMMYIAGTLDEVLLREFTHVPDVLLSDLFPRLFPLVH